MAKEMKFDVETIDNGYVLRYATGSVKQFYHAIYCPDEAGVSDTILNALCEEKDNG